MQLEAINKLNTSGGAGSPRTPMPQGKRLNQQTKQQKSYKESDEMKRWLNKEFFIVKYGSNDDECNEEYPTEERIEDF